MIIAKELNREAVKVAGMPLSRHHHRETTSKDIGVAILNHLRHLLLSHHTKNTSRHTSKSKATVSPQWGYTQHHCHLHLRTREVTAVATVDESEEGTRDVSRTTTVRETALGPLIRYQSGFEMSEEWVE